MDGLDVYIDDYNVSEPIPQAMLAGLAHARDMLFGPADGEERPQPDAVPAAQAASGEGAAPGEADNPAAPAQGAER
jgi:hypothetical protein